MWNSTQSLQKQLWHGVRIHSGGGFASMNTNKLIRTIKSFGLAFAVVFGIVAISGYDVNAQNRGNGRQNDDRYDQRDRDDRNYGQNRQDDRYNGRDQNGNQSYRFAFQKGYKDGMKQAKRDVRGTRSNSGGYGNYGGNGSYGGYGNSRNRGNNGTDVQAYRQGYQRGYREVMDRERYNNGNRRSSIWPF